MHRRGAQIWTSKSGSQTTWWSRRTNGHSIWDKNTAASSCCKVHKVKQCIQYFHWWILNITVLRDIAVVNGNQALVNFFKHGFSPLWWRGWQWLSSDWLLPRCLGFCVTDAPASASAFLPASRPLIPPNGGCHLAANLNAQTTKLPHLAKLIPARRAPVPHS